MTIQNHMLLHIPPPSAITEITYLALFFAIGLAAGMTIMFLMTSRRHARESSGR